MSDSTETYWAADGVSLQTHAFDIQTLGGDRLAPPTMRGDDWVVPSQPGARWMPKVVDSRTITLAMWVAGCEEDGSRPTDQSAARMFDENWRKLRSLLWTPNRTIALSKRFWVNGTLVTATAEAQFVGGLAPNMNGPARAQFTVDLRLADPYFYGVVKTEPLSASETVVLSGDDITRKIAFEIQGSRTNTVIRNNTLDVQVEYHAAIASGGKVDIDVKAFTSVTDPPSGPNFKSVGSIRNTGDASWFLLQPGNNAITVASSAGTGAVTMVYQEAWL